MGHPRKTKVPQIPNAHWQFHRNNIEKLFLKERMPLVKVIERMAKEHKFHADLPQYHYQLKKWGIRVNVKGPEWQSLLQVLSGLPDSGKHHKVYLNNHLVPAEKIARERLRRPITDINTDGRISQSDPVLPAGFTIDPPPNFQSLPHDLDTPNTSPEWTPVDQKTNSMPLTASFPSDIPASIDMDWQHQQISFGIFEPNGWIRTIDWSLLASLSQRNSGPARFLGLNTIKLDSVIRSSLPSNGQLIVRDPSFLVPFHLLSSLLNGTESPGEITNSQIHGVLRALPKFVVLKLFEDLESPYSDMLRERVFASALDAEDVEIVDTMLSLGLDSSEMIWFDSKINGGPELPLKKALHLRNFSLCRVIVNHRCKPRYHLPQGSVQDLVLDELLEGYYRLMDRHFPLTSSEWDEFSDLILTSLSRGAHPTNECFFVSFYSQSLATKLMGLGDNGVNDWIKRGLLASRWPEARSRSSASKATESLQVYWMLTFILRHQKEHIATGDPMILAELVRALEVATEQKDLQATLIVIEACSEMDIRPDWITSGNSFTDVHEPSLEQNSALAQTSVKKSLHGSQTHRISDSHEHSVDRSNNLEKQSIKLYEDVAKSFIMSDDTVLLQLFEQYRSDTCLRGFLHSQSDAWNQNLLRVALENNQLDIVVDLFKRLNSRSDSALAHILHHTRTDAIYEIFCNSEPWSAALSLTLTDRSSFGVLENLVYRFQEDNGSQLSLLGLHISSNADQQIMLRCLCYYAIHTDHHLLLRWLVDNDLDMGEFIQGQGEGGKVFFENMRKIAVHCSGLMPNMAPSLVGTHVYPSILSIAAMKNNVPLIHLLVELGVDGRDSMALARAVGIRAHSLTITTLLEVAGFRNQKRIARHYGSAALREAIRQKDYTLIRELASKVDINGIEFSPNEMSNPLFGEPLSPLGAAIFAQDNMAVEILLNEGCDPQALVRYNGFPNEVKRGAHLERLSPLLAAIDMDDLDIVQKLVENKSPVAPGPTQGLLRSPLQRAAEVGSLGIVEYLLAQNAPVDDPPFYSGGTPLQLAAMSGHVGVAELLIQHGANPDHPPAIRDGRTAFEAAAEWGRANIMSLLIKQGVDLDIKSGDDMRSQYDRALQFAENSGHQASKRFVQKLYEDTVAARFHLSIVSYLNPAYGRPSSEELFVGVENMPWIPNGHSLLDG